MVRVVVDKPGFYTVTYKRPRGRELHHVDTHASSVLEASRKAARLSRLPAPWQEYGISGPRSCARPGCAVCAEHEALRRS